MYRSYLGVVCVTVVGRFLVSFACRVSGDARVASRNVTCLLTWTNRIAVMRAQARLSTWRQLFPSQVQIFAMCAISTFHQSFRISTGSTILTIKFGGFFKIYFFFRDIHCAAFGVENLENIDAKQCMYCLKIMFNKPNFRFVNFNGSGFKFCSYLKLYLVLLFCCFIIKVNLNIKDVFSFK